MSKPVRLTSTFAQGIRLAACFTSYGPLRSGVCAPSLAGLPRASAASRMEAAGIEPASRDHFQSGLYMFSRFFNLNHDAENGHPAPWSSRLNLAHAPTSECTSQPAFFGRCDAGFTSYRGCLNLGSHYNRGGSEADSACNIVVGSYDLLEFLARPIERPGHATAIKGIRSKPVAPECGPIYERAKKASLKFSVFSFQ